MEAETRQGKTKVILVSILVCLLLTGIAAFFILNGKGNSKEFDLKSKEQSSINDLLNDRDYINELREKNTVKLSNNKQELKYKSYNSLTKEILIEDKNYNPIIRMKLTSPYIVSGLIASSDTKVAEFYLEDWKDGRTNLVDTMNFYDARDNYKTTSKNFRFKYATEKQECSILEKGEVCENQIIWTEFKTLGELPSKNIKISLWANTIASEKIEWVPTIEGFDLLEWASWLVSTATYTQNLSVTTYETQPQGLTFGNNGLKMYVVGYGQETFNEFNCSMAYNVSTCIYSTQIKHNMTNPTGVFFNPNGLQAFIVSYSGQAVRTFNLSTAWLINTTYGGIISTTIAEELSPQGMSWNNAGTQMFIIGDGSKKVSEYNCSSAWGTSSCVLRQQFSVNAQDGTPRGVAFGNSGVKMYVVGSGYDHVYEYNLSSAYNVSTAVYSTNYSVSSWETIPTDLVLSSTGSRLFVVGDGMDNIIEFKLADEVDASLTVTLYAPLNDTNATATNVIFNCTARDDQKIMNVSLYINDILNYTETNGVTNFTELNVTNYFAEGNYNWTCKAYDNATIPQSGTATAWAFSIDLGLPPSINITYPYNIVNYQKLNNNLIVNWTISDPHLDSCFGSYDGGVTNFSVVCLNKNITINVTTTNNNSFWLWANDTLGNIANASNNWTYNIIENLQRYNSSSYETKEESFILNITYNSSKTISAKLYYNGTSYAATKSGTGSNILFERTIDIPSITTPSNKSFYWETTLDGTASNSPSVNQSIKNISFYNCPPADDMKYLNFSFKDESTNVVVNASAESSDFTYWIGSGTETKTLTFLNSTDNFEYDFCFSSNDTSVYIDSDFRYSKTGYPTRTLVYDNKKLTNSTTSKVLYLLATAEGIYSSFQVLTNQNQPISGVSAVMSRYISSAWTEISSGTTGSDGIITFWNNPDLQYNYTFVKSGYDNYSTLLYPTQASYTIYLGGGTTTTNYTNYEQGVNYKISPQAGTELLNNTNYIFLFNLTSNYYSLDSFGMKMFGSGKYIGGNSSTSALGGNLSYTLNTGTNSTIVMTYYWIISGNVTNKTSYLWGVFNTSDTQWSINNFFTDLKRYTNVTATGHGMFGMTLFSRTLIIFIFMFISIGMISYYSGFTGFAPIMTMLFAEIVLFDVVLGLIPAPSIGTNPIMERGFPTLLVALVMIGAWIKEWR